MGVFEMSSFFFNGLENPLKNPYFYASISHVNFRGLPGGDFWNWRSQSDRTVLSFECHNLKITLR